MEIYVGIEEANVSTEGASTQKDAEGEVAPEVMMAPEEILPVPVLAESPAEIVPTLQPVVTPLRMSEAEESNGKREEKPVPSGGQITPQQRWRLKNKVKLALYSKERRRKIKEAKHNTKAAMGE